MNCLSQGWHFFGNFGYRWVYKGHVVDYDLTIDVLVEQMLVLEIKSVHQLLPVHEAQLLTYLRVSGLRIGLLLNFNEETSKASAAVCCEATRSRQAASANCRGR